MQVYLICSFLYICFSRCSIWIHSFYVGIAHCNYYYIYRYKYIYIYIYWTPSHKSINIVSNYLFLHAACQLYLKLWFVVAWVWEWFQFYRRRANICTYIVLHCTLWHNRFNLTKTYITLLLFKMRISHEGNTTLAPIKFKHSYTFQDIFGLCLFPEKELLSLTTPCSKNQQERWSKLWGRLVSAAAQ